MSNINKYMKSILKSVSNSLRVVTHKICSALLESKSNVPIIRYFYFLTSLILMANWEVNRLTNPKVCFKKYLKDVEENFKREAVT